MVNLGVRVEGGMVLGPSLQALLAEVKQASGFGNTLHITGESGTGKELVAQTFHKHGPRHEGAFIAVNCAAIPQGLAERLLFGARRGAYSGADANADGYIQAAAGGTLFLDEVGDLDLAVQAKLLRVLETRELFPVGAARPHTVDLQVCSATNKDLKQLAGLGRFREDLYYRIGRPMVAIAPLRKRPEEIPWLIEAAIKRVSTTATPYTSLIETCLLRPWPGNVRELLVEIRSAAQSAACQNSPRVESRHLPEGAGTAMRSTPEPVSIEISEPTPSPTSPKSVDPAERSRLEAALRLHHGNVSGAARALGLHRTQVRRLLERHGLDPQRFAGDEKLAIDMEEL
jgi:transcriptional regulator with PAS, ATPase and Fis domain